MTPTATVILNRLLARARLRHVQVLVQLAELGSVRRTADVVGMSQPRVTQVLQDLEAMLEVALFQRHARGVRPTPACSDLLPIARQVLVGLASGAEAVATRRHQGEGVVRLLASTAAVNGLIAHALPAFADRCPAIQVQLKEAELDEILLAIGRAEVDVAACRLPRALPEPWRFEPVLEDEMVIACSARHRLAGRRRVRWADLAGETWLPPPAGSLARAYQDEIAQRFAEGLRQSQVITRVHAATWWMLRARPLLCVVPYGVIRHLVEAGELAVLDVGEPMPIAPLGVVVRDAASGTAADRFLQCLRDDAASRPTRLGGHRSK